MNTLLRSFALAPLYAAVALAMTWPLPASLSTALPLGHESCATVTLFNAWTVWWNADRAAHGFADYWNAPIFHPTRDTFVFSEAQPTTLAVAPVLWLTGNATLAYNLYLLLTLTLNGWCAERLLRCVGLGWWAAACAGVTTQVLPFVCWQLGVLQLTVLWGVLWTVHAAWRFVAAPGWRTAVVLGLAFGASYAACNYYGLFSAVVLGPAGVWLLHRGWLSVRPWLHALLASAVAAALVSPIVAMQHRVAGEHRWQREWSNVRELSAHVRDYTDTPEPQWLDALEDSSPPRADRWMLGPGWLKLFAAGLGCAAGLMSASRRRFTLMAATVGGLALVYSLGPNLELWSLTPYRFLFDHVPGFAQIRSPFRFAVFVQLAAVWLSAVTIDSLANLPWQRLVAGFWLQVARRQGADSVCRTATDDQQPTTAFSVPAWMRHWRPRGLLSQWPAMVLGASLVGETLPQWYHRPEFLRSLPSHAELPPWVEFLRDETPPRAAVVCLPFVRGISVEEYESTTWWMWWGMFHRRTLLNGYSGFFPESFVQLRLELADFPETGGERLTAMGAAYAVVERRTYTPAALAEHPQTQRWEWLFGDELAQIDVYKLPPPDTSPRE